MSKLGQIRKLWSYQSQAPRCGNCQNFRKPNTFLRESLPVTTPATCKSGNFIVGPNGICDKHKKAQ